MNQSTGEKPKLILTGASGIFGSAFVAAYRERFSIIAITNTRGLPVDSQKSYTFSLVDRTRSDVASVTELKCDLLDTDRVSALIDALIGVGGEVTFLVNAAADTRFYGPTTDAAFYREKAIGQLNTNVIAPLILSSLLFHKCWKAIPVNRQKASVLNVSSASGRNVFRGVGQATYASSKAALDMTTLHMADEYRPFGIRVNGLAPGAFPADVSTEKVVKAAFKVLTSNVTGRIYALDDAKRSQNTTI